MEVLHGDEFVPAVAVGDVLQGLELPGGHLYELAIFYDHIFVSSQADGMNVRTELAPIYREEEREMVSLSLSTYNILTSPLRSPTATTQA